MSRPPVTATPVPSLLTPSQIVDRMAEERQRNDNDSGVGMVPTVESPSMHTTGTALTVVDSPLLHEDEGRSPLLASESQR